VGFEPCVKRANNDEKNIAFISKGEWVRRFNKGINLSAQTKRGAMLKE